jgi:hypothetical protein
MHRHSLRVLTCAGGGVQAAYMHRKSGNINAMMKSVDSFTKLKDRENFLQMCKKWEALAVVLRGSGQHIAAAEVQIKEGKLLAAVRTLGICLLHIRPPVMITQECCNTVLLFSIAGSFTSAPPHIDDIVLLIQVQSARTTPWCWPQDATLPTSSRTSTSSGSKTLQDWQ